MGYIPQHALQNLKLYQYKGVDKSILSKYVLNPYWNQLVKLWPKSVAPNTITLTGLSLVFINFITLLYYDPSYLTAKHGAGMPNWIYFTWAAGLFMYQSLDAIDGKQARRTQMAGPLGEMFDHGCDAINTTLEAILTCYALNLGRSWWTVASEIATLANFYLTTWEEYHTGQLYLGVFSGPVEGILMIVGMYVITGIYGPSFWDQGILTFLHLGKLKIILPDVPLNVLFMYLGAVGLGFNIVTSYRNVLKHIRLRYSMSSPYSSSSSLSTPSTPSSPASPASHPEPEPISKLKSKSKLLLSRDSPIRPFFRLTPFPLSVLLQLAWLSAPSPSLSYPSYSSSPSPSPSSSSSYSNSVILNSSLFIPFLCAWGLQFAHQVGRMILAHLTKRRDMPFWEWLWVWTALCAVDANLPRLAGRPPILQPTPLHYTLTIYTSLLLSLLTYARFVYLVINDITNFLGIACFTVRKKDGEGVWRSSVPAYTPGPSVVPTRAPSPAPITRTSGTGGNGLAYRGAGGGDGDGRGKQSERVVDGDIVIESNKTK